MRTSTRIRRHPVTRNVNVEHTESLALGERVANKAASIIGSWRFIVVMSFFLAAWISLNVSAWARHWDPYPFILLNLVLSIQAAYSAPVINGETPGRSPGWQNTFARFQRRTSSNRV